MKRKQRQQGSSSETKTSSSWRDALIAYAEHPQKYSSEVVLDFNDQAVLIKDLYPKVHPFYFLRID
jgi:hypothetical protein